ncbi:MAG: hypothetical protein ABJN34_05295 [Litoreibacter sp.]|uniref:hypothetical protein n=1 Tax=Litoreibacter sp. TaxID=1969459 RepID=UPI003299D45C
MIELDTIIGIKTATAVDVNNLLVPSNSLAAHLRQYSEPALFHSDGAGKYHMSLSGSLFRARFNDRYFVFVSRHQMTLGNYEHDQIALLNYDKKTLVTSHRAVFPDNASDEYDCAVYEFTDLIKSGKLPATSWYDLKTDWVRDHLPKPNLVVAIGYPGHRNSIDYEAAHYGASPNAVWGVEASPVIDGRLSFVPKPEILFEPAGMSGCPVFGCSLDNLAPTCFFAGILTNATQNRFNFFSFSRMRPLLERLLASG